MTLLKPCNAIINVEKLETEAGYSVLQLKNEEIIESYNKIIHIINLDDFETTIRMIERHATLTFNLPDDEINLKTLYQGWP